MRKHLQKQYALTDIGAKTLENSIYWTLVQSLSFLFPYFLGTFFIYSYIQKLLGETVNLLSVWTYLIISACIFAVMYFISYTQYYKAYDATYAESAKLRIKVAEKIRLLPLAFFSKRDLADLSSTVMSDVAEIEQIASHSLPSAYAAMGSTSIIALLLLIYHWQLALALLWVIPLSILTFVLSLRYQKRAHEKIIAVSLAIRNSMQENLDCVQEIKAYNLAEQASAETGRLLDQYEGLLLKEEIIIGILVNIPGFILKFGTASITLAGAYLYAQGQASILNFLIFLIMSANIYTPIILTYSNLAGLIYLGPRVKRMREIYDLETQTGAKEIKNEGYDIEFKNVKFAYEEDQETIKDISFIAKQGEITALVGPSGGGKSTVAKLAARFWDIEGGQIKLGGVDISSVDPETLLESYSIVFQDVVLFNNSIMENIRMGRKDASDAEVKEAARIARCTEFIEKLEDGYDSQIGENGERLSGGERQRISIARAILKDSPIILLDEATASLDAENESKIQEAISELIRNKTVIVIAHRMRTIINADKIIVIAKGKIKEMGSPQELIQGDTTFRQMYERQQKERQAI